LKVKIRVRMSASDAHYGGNLVDGAKILELFGDVATELLIRHDGDEGLRRRNNSCWQHVKEDEVRGEKSNYFKARYKRFSSRCIRSSNRSV